MTHPYKDLSDYHFWLKAVTYKVSGAIDPVITSLPINKSEKISTMGSCFAQHLSRSIQEVDFNYFVAESGGASYSEAERVKRNFGVFSARYGNIYTIKQAIQLFDRAFDIDKFNENIWSLGSSYVDSFRPRIEPLGFASKEDLLQDRNIHLKCVRDVFINSDWLIFTLGLTEAWRSKVDGAIYPIAPGVFGGEFNELEHEFINFSVFDVLDDLRIFINKCRSINANLKILLT